MSDDPDLFGGLLSSTPVPRTDKDWRDLSISAEDIFSPHAPIDDETLFSGRSELIERLIETVFQRGRHAILFGERGVGKTSLASIIRDRIFAKLSTIRVIKRNCTKQHTYRLMWVHALDDFIFENKVSEQFLADNPNPYDIHKIIDLIAVNERPVFIFDEFDRVQDPDALPIMADTIKYLADNSSRSTIIIVGVADSVGELFGGHPSIQRNVQQIHMPRMSRDELQSIIANRLPLLGMSIGPTVSRLIVELSQGLPAYTHLQGQQAALSAIRRRSLVIEKVDLEKL